jgi:hypothetical protein
MASMPRSFLAVCLPRAANLATAPRGRRLGRLAAGVGVDLGVQHQQFHVLAGGQHGVHPGRADVIGPAVPADDPQAAPDQLVGQPLQLPGVRGVHSGQAPAQLDDPLALGRDGGLAVLVGLQDGPGQVLPRPGGEPLDQLAGAGLEPVGWPAGCPARTRRCPRTASSPRPAPAPRR